MDLEIFPRITNDDDPCDFCGFGEKFGPSVGARYLRHDRSALVWGHRWCTEHFTMKRRLWTSDDGKQIPIEDMTLGHLCNTIRYMGERLEEARAAGDEQQITRIESYLGDLQAEQERRLPEIEKAQGLLGVLLKSARK